MCPRRLVNRRDLVEAWLRDVVRSGRIGAWDGLALSQRPDHGCPVYVRHRESEVDFEARQATRGERRHPGIFGIDMTALLFYTGGHGNGHDT